MDVYAFAILLAELYLGTRPYQKTEYSDLPQAQLLVRIFEGLRPDTEGIPSAMKQLLEDGWHQDPRMRPSFSELLVRLPRLATLKLPQAESTRSDEDVDVTIGSRSRWLTLPEAEIIEETPNDDLYGSDDDLIEEYTSNTIFDSED